MKQGQSMRGEGKPDPLAPPIFHWPLVLLSFAFPHLTNEDKYEKTEGYEWSVWIMVSETLIKFKKIVNKNNSLSILTYITLLKLRALKIST